MQIPFILVYLGSWLAISGGIYGLFNKAGDAVNKDSKDAVSDWLKNAVIVDDRSNWAVYFSILFDRVFGQKHFSWSCFIKSGLLSIILFPTLFLLVGLLAVGSLEEFEIRTVLTTALIGTMFNVIPDYLSLLLSRRILVKMAKSTNHLIRFFFLIVDLLLSILVIQVWFVIIPILFIPNPIAEILPQFDNFSLDYFENAFSLSFADSEFQDGRARSIALMNGISIYTSLFTSIWIWFFALSGASLKVVQKLQIGINFLKRILDIKNEPFKAMGFTSIIFVSFIYLLIGFFILL